MFPLVCVRAIREHHGFGVKSRRKLAGWDRSRAAGVDGPMRFFRVGR